MYIYMIDYVTCDVKTCSCYFSMDEKVLIWLHTLLPSDYLKLTRLWQQKTYEPCRDSYLLVTKHMDRFSHDVAQITHFILDTCKHRVRTGLKRIWI